MIAVLKDPNALQACFDGAVPAGLANEGPAVDTARLSRKLVRLALRYRSGRPRPATRLWFDIDTTLYRPFERPDDRHFKGAWLAISGLTKGRRIAIPLAGGGLEQFARRTQKRYSWPGLRIDVEERIAFHGAIRIRPVRRTNSIEAGLDKGYRTLVTLTTGDASSAVGYGEDAKSLIARVADDSVERLKQRRRLAAHERSLRNSASPIARRRARRIRRANLGRAGVDRRTRRDRSLLRGQIGAALNELFRTHPDLSVLHVEHLGFLTARLSARMNRYLGRWLKGYLHVRLREKAELNGVALNVVNAAYTSQTCPRCWFTASKNRIGERFECRSCGFTGSSDAVAATNVLRRGRDAAISRFTPKWRVKQILDARWRSALLEAPGAQTRVDLGLPVGAANEALCTSDTTSSTRAVHIPDRAVRTEDRAATGLIHALRSHRVGAGGIEPPTTRM